MRQSSNKVIFRQTSLFLNSFFYKILSHMFKTTSIAVFHSNSLSDYIHKTYITPYKLARSLARSSSVWMNHFVHSSRLLRSLVKGNRKEKKKRNHGPFCFFHTLCISLNHHRQCLLTGKRTSKLCDDI
jgi:hypothetical protein